MRLRRINMPWIDHKWIKETCNNCVFRGKRDNNYYPCHIGKGMIHKDEVNNEVDCDSWSD
jgi:hypothetical protein